MPSSGRCNRQLFQPLGYKGIDHSRSSQIINDDISYLIHTHWDVVPPFSDIYVSVEFLRFNFQSMGCDCALLYIDN